jgi:hypothetical protein
MKCKYCDNNVIPERVELGYLWCTSPRCVSFGMIYRNEIVLVCGHKSGYQPMFRKDVKNDASNPKR